ncbi:putative plant self-incompatibility S1 [Helianthus annuus]|nr:putative plant self-incompatibility S1 [Helianthus annuus]
MLSSSKLNCLMGKLLFLFILLLNIFDTSYANIVSNYSDNNCITFQVVVHIQTQVNNLRLHCYSKDDDLGDVTRNAGEEYQIRFCLDLFGRSHFWCHFNWESKEEEFNVFKEVAPPKSQPYCTQIGHNIECYWMVDNMGFWIPRTLQPQPSDWVRLYDWTPTQGQSI